MCGLLGVYLVSFLHMEPLFPGKSEVDELNKIYELLGTPSEKSWHGYWILPGVSKIKFVDYTLSRI